MGTRVVNKPGAFRLQSLNERNESPLFQRRKSAHQETGGAAATSNGDNDDSTVMSLGPGGVACRRCGEGFAQEEEMVNSNGEIWHTPCFVLEQEQHGAMSNLRNGEREEQSSAAHIGPAPTHPLPPSAPAPAPGGEGLSREELELLAAAEEAMSGEGGTCERCDESMSLAEPVVNYEGRLWHPSCFVCAQCFQPFPDGMFYEFEGRKYCEHCFHVLYAPCCAKCGSFVIGRVIKAMQASWCPGCFQCELCSCSLADSGFIKNAGRALCRECNAREKAKGMGKYVCFKCHSIIEEGHIKFKGEPYHPYHFNCSNPKCGVELNADAREKNGELFCLRCHDKMGIPICGACRRPIEDRIVHALGKAWHVEHFVCARCEKPFLGTRHYEKKGLAYCEMHYHQLFGNICFVCNQVITGDVFSALNKAWCVDCFSCYICDKKMNQKTKFYDLDLKPVCKGCHEKFPAELKKRLKKAYEASPAKK